MGDMTTLRFTSPMAARWSTPIRGGFIDHFQASGEAEHPRLKPLGPEPLTGWTSEAFAARLRDCQKAGQDSTLDQKFVVGVGNIYACEALRSKINPRLPANRLVQKNVHRADGRGASRCCPNSPPGSHRGGWFELE